MADWRHWRQQLATVRRDKAANRTSARHDAKVSIRTSAAGRDAKSGSGSSKELQQSFIARR
jgi:hypothetical protein